MPLFFRRTAAQKSWLRALEALLCKVFQGIPFHWMRGRVPRSSPPASGHLRTACKGSIDKAGPLPWQRPLFVSWRRLKCFRRQTGQRWKAQALNVGGGVSALVVLLHLAHLVGSEEGLQVVHLSLELTADIGL